MEGQQERTGESVVDSREHVRQVLQRAVVTESSRGWARSESSADRNKAGASSAASYAQSAMRAQLRASVSLFVRRLRDDGLPPEQTLVELKETVWAVGTLDRASADGRDLMEEMVRWAVAAYYDTDHAK